MNPVKQLWAAVTVLTLLGAGISRAQDEEESAAPERRWSVRGRLTLATNYNDNILEYSPLDLVKFDSLRYAPENLKKFSIDRVSDDVTTARVRVSVANRLFGEDLTILRLRGNQSVYAANHIRDYGSWSLELRQRFSRSNYVAFTYSLLPRYYLRNLWYHQVPERNPYKLFSRYVEAEFNRKGYALEAGRDFSRRVSANVSYEYEYTEYNREFAERTNNAHNLRGDVSVELGRVVRAQAGYRYAISWAHGRDNPDSTIADISNRSHRVHAGLDLRLRTVAGVPLTVGLDGVYEHVAYLSDKRFDPLTDPAADKYHYGRLDNMVRLGFQIGYEVSNRLDLFAQYGWEQDRSNLPPEYDTGSYQVHQGGFGLTLSF